MTWGHVRTVSFSCCLVLICDMVRYGVRNYRCLVLVFMWVPINVRNCSNGDRNHRNTHDWRACNFGVSSFHAVVRLSEYSKHNAMKGFGDHLGCEHSPLAQVVNAAVKTSSIRVCKVIEARYDRTVLLVGAAVFFVPRVPVCVPISDL